MDMNNDFTNLLSGLFLIPEEAKLYEKNKVPSIHFFFCGLLDV
jgi:hypothetical protein